MSDTHQLIYVNIKTSYIAPNLYLWAYHNSFNIPLIINKNIK